MEAADAATTNDYPALMTSRMPEGKDPEAEYWDGRYSAKELVWSAGPNLFLPPEVEGMAPGTAVDLACGEGRNAIWLAEQGWDVTGVDFSEVAIEKAAAIADRSGVSVKWVCADVTTWQPGSRPGATTAGFDLVIAFYLQVASVARKLVVANAARLLGPGGVMVVVAHDSANLTHGVGGPQDPKVLYTAAEVERDIASTGLGIQIERAETVERVVEGAEPPALDCFVRARRPG